VPLASNATENRECGVLSRILRSPVVLESARVVAGGSVRASCDERSAGAVERVEAEWWCGGGSVSGEHGDERFAMDELVRVAGHHGLKPIGPPMTADEAAVIVETAG
jgi:hypothetical protein